MSQTFTNKMHSESSNKIIIKKSDLKRVTEISQEAERKRKYRRLIKSREDVGLENLRGFGLAYILKQKNLDLILQKE